MQKIFQQIFDGQEFRVGKLPLPCHDVTAYDRISLAENLQRLLKIWCKNLQRLASQPF